MLAAYLSLVNAISPEPLVAGESLMVTTSLHELSESTLQGRVTARLWKRSFCDPRYRGR